MTPDDLKAFRKRHKLTQQSLADLLGMERNSINLMEMGVRPIMRTTELALEAIRRKLQKRKRK